MAMRIIAGSLRSRSLEAPPGMNTRPTSDRLRETLFNVLTPRLNSNAAGVSFLDLYAGSGAVGLEALSRGAERVAFVERAPAALKVLHGNLERLKLTTGWRVFPSSVSAFLRRSAKSEGYDVVFLDPPYDAAEEYAATLGLLGGAAGALLADGAVVIAEHRRKERLADRYGTLGRTRLLEQGDAALSFYHLPLAVGQTPSA
jgi:16S rRNA (guanine(966)-N(2))-methyltransferase RsmD